MFRRNKAIKEYKNSIEKIKIPEIKGEEYIKVSTRREIRVLPIIKRSSIVFAAICALVVLNFVSAPKSINTDFTIKAYAGTNTIDLESGKIVELPSGWIDNSTYNMQGLLIEGDNIKRVSLDVDNGSIDYIRTNSYHAGKEIQYIAPNGGLSSGRSGYSGLVTAKFISDEVMNKIGNTKLGENIYDDKDIRDALDLSEEHSEDKYPNEDKSFDGNQFSSYNEFDNDENWSKHYILWIPDMQFLKDISQGKEIDYSSVEGANITFTITFKDDSTITKTMNLSFNENGNLNCELD